MLEILSRDSKTYPETVEAARQAAERLKEALGSKIIGQTLHNDEAKATRVIPAADDNQLANSLMWTVRVEAVDGSGNGYSIGLREFLDADEIEALFSQHFQDIDIGYLADEKFRQEFRMKGSTIDMNKPSQRDLYTEGHKILSFHIEHQQKLPGFEILDGVWGKFEYTWLIGAIHSAKPGDVISVPTERMRDFAHKYMAFAHITIYLLVECGETVSVGGVIQNVRRSVDDLVSPKFSIG
jgi:hypothetical protein